MVALVLLPLPLAHLVLPDLYLLLSPHLCVLDYVTLFSIASFFFFLNLYLFKEDSTESELSF